MGVGTRWSLNFDFDFTKPKMIQFVLLFSRQGKPRLQKWFTSYPDKTKKKITRELVTTILGRGPKMSSFIEWNELKIVYKRYASLYFCCAIENTDNELITLEVIHNYEKAYFILDEFLLGGEVQETSKKNILNAIRLQDFMQEEETPQGLFEDAGLG